MGATAEQLELIDGIPAEVRESIAKTGNYSGELLQAWAPEKLALARNLRALNVPIRTIALETGLSKSSVESLIQRDAVSIAEIKADLVKRLHRAAGVAAEVIIDDLDSGKLRGRDAAIALGVLVDKAQLLGGQATSIVRKEESPTDHDALASYIQSLPEVTEVEATVIPMPQEPVGSGEKVEQRAEPAADPGEPVVGDH